MGKLYSILNFCSNGEKRLRFSISRLSRNWKGLIIKCLMVQRGFGDRIWFRGFSLAWVTEVSLKTEPLGPWIIIFLAQEILGSQFTGHSTKYHWILSWGRENRTKGDTSNFSNNCQGWEIKCCLLRTVDPRKGNREARWVNIVVLSCTLQHKSASSKPFSALKLKIFSFWSASWQFRVVRIFNYLQMARFDTAASCWGAWLSSICCWAVIVTHTPQSICFFLRGTQLFCDGFQLIGIWVLPG